MGSKSSYGVDARCRPYVIRNFKGDRSLVKAATVEELLSKGSKMFKIEDARLLLEDGTEIDDEYLAACDEYTVFTVLKSSENIKCTYSTNR